MRIMPEPRLRSQYGVRMIQGLSDYLVPPPSFYRKKLNPIVGRLVACLRSQSCLVAELRFESILFDI